MALFATSAWGAEDYVCNFSKHSTWTYSSNDNTVSLNSVQSLAADAEESASPIVLTYQGSSTSDKIQASSHEFTIGTDKVTLANQLWINGASSSSRVLSIIGLSGKGTMTLLGTTGSNRSVGMGIASGNMGNADHYTYGKFLDAAKTEVTSINITTALSSTTTYYINVSGGYAIYALIWTPENTAGPFAVTYDKNNEGASGTMTDENSPYAKDATVTVLGNSFTAPTGMSFTGWNTKADGSGTSYSEGDTFDAVKDVTLFAQWAYPATGTGTITYSLTYDKNEVTPSISGVSTLSSSSTAFTLSNLTIGVNSDKKPGYSAKIENAYLDDESRNVALQFTVADGYTFAPSDVSMTIFANSTSNMRAKVVLSDGVTTVQSEELECASSADSDIEFASGAFAGKKFVGNVNVTVYLWLTSGSGKRAYIKSPVTITGIVTEMVAPTITSPTSNPEVAEYTIGDAITALSVTATGDPTPTYQWYRNSSASTTGAISVGGATSASYTPSNEAVIDSFYYCVATNLKGSATSPFFRVKVSAAPTYDATYVSDKGSAPSKEAAVSNITLPTISPVPSFIHTAWTADQAVKVSGAIVAAGTEIEVGAEVYLTQNTTFTAVWTPLYSVTYVLNGPSGDAPTQADVTAGTEIALAAAPSWADHTFAGWLCSADSEIKAAESSYTMTAANTTFTAQWLNHYTISYEHGANGTGSIASGTKVEGIAYTLSSKRFTRAGYVQVGWATTDGGAKEYDLGASYTDDVAQTFYPYWVAATIYTFDKANAKSIATLKTEGWTFNTDVFDAEPTDTEGYANTVAAMNTAGLTAPKSNSMDDNAIAFAKNTGAYAQFDLGQVSKIYELDATLYGGSSSSFNEDIKYIGADGTTVIKTYTNALNAGNWKANSISKTEEVDNVRYIRVYGASKWTVMYDLSIVYNPLYAISCADADNGSVEADKSLAAAGETVTLTLHPDPGYKVATVKVNDGDALAVTNNEATFTMSAGAANVVATFVVKPAAPISWVHSDTVATNLTIYLDKAYTLPALSNEQGLTVNYTSSNESVASFEAGVLYVNGAGSTTISASFAGNDDYKATVASYSLTAVAKYPTALDNTADEIKAVKFFENGQLFIRRGDKVYTITGELVK